MGCFHHTRCGNNVNRGWRKRLMARGKYWTGRGEIHAAGVCKVRFGVKSVYSILSSSDFSFLDYWTNLPRQTGFRSYTHHIIFTPHFFLSLPSNPALHLSTSVLQQGVFVHVFNSFPRLGNMHEPLWLTSLLCWSIRSFDKWLHFSNDLWLLRQLHCSPRCHLLNNLFFHNKFRSDIRPHNEQANSAAMVNFYFYRQAVPKSFLQ